MHPSLPDRTPKPTLDRSASEIEESWTRANPGEKMPEDLRAQMRLAEAERRHRKAEQKVARATNEISRRRAEREVERIDEEIRHWFSIAFPALANGDEDPPGRTTATCRGCGARIAVSRLYSHTGLCQDPCWLRATNQTERTAP